MSEPVFLFVFEGKKHESKYLHDFLKCLNIKINRIEIAYCTNIYKLYKKISKDPGLDTFELLKEFHAIKGNLKDYTRDDIASIYFFFDYDGHHISRMSNIPNNNIVKLMLEHFNNETEQGKLYISYPMLESLRHKIDNFANVTSEIELGCKYKNPQNFNHIFYIKKHCKKLASSHIKKANYLVNKRFKIPVNLIEQNDIFTAQLTKHIKPNKEVAILNAFPLFYLDYKGVGNIDL